MFRGELISRFNDEVYAKISFEMVVPSNCSILFTMDTSICCSLVQILAQKGRTVVVSDGESKYIREEERNRDLDRVHESWLWSLSHA
jgi:hypothetical protein